MSNAPFSGGPLQQSDLLGIWRSVMDQSYTEPFILAGDGEGLEAWNQAFAQAARTSEAIDVSMESLFILPWSGQTNPPAAGPAQATVTLTISRTGLLERPLVLGAGLIWVDDVEPDYSPTGTQQVNTGLRYSLAETVVFEPGEMGPIEVEAIAERPGYGYNNPQPGFLNLLEQPGTMYYNVEAAVVNNIAGTPIAASSIASTQMTCIDVPHVFIPGHVGQYIEVTAGSNAGFAARIVSYRPPNAMDTDGGQVGLEMLVAVHAATFSGTFDAGELVAISGATSGYATFVDAVQVGAILKASFVVRCGTVAVGSVFTGSSSGAALTVSLVYKDASNWVTTTPPTVPSTEQWKILDWVVDWGLSVTNAASPSGGTAGVLDLLGRERNLPRAPGEVDEQYRHRVASIADVVTPNAIKRRLNRTLTQGPLGLSWCLREIGTPLFPGFFYGDGTIYGDFYDYDAQYFAGGIGSGVGFQPYEPVTQTVDGIVATGKLLIRYAVPGISFVAGKAGTTGRSPSQIVVGVSGLRIGYPFVAGEPVVGTLSGFEGTPTTVTSGTGTAYVNGQNVIQQSATGATAVSTLWRIYVDYLRMRAYFVVCIQRSDNGDFGFAWGDGFGHGGLIDFWDTGPGWNDFYDGEPLGAAQQYLSTWSAINAIRAGGVLFEFEPASGPCV
jgi:hypothetical protein